MRQGSADGGGVLWEARRGRESGEEAIAMVDAPRPVPQLPDRDPGLRIAPAARARGNLEHESLRPHGVVVQLGACLGEKQRPGELVGCAAAWIMRTMARCDAITR